MLSPLDDLGYVDPFQIMERDIPDFEKSEMDTYISSRKTLHDRLIEAYMREICDHEDDEEPVKESFLLEKIVKEDSLSRLIVNLYPGNEGYTLMLRKTDGSEVETVRLSYEENEFLDYLDSQELPPLLVEVLESSQVDIFHDGCVVVELRDYRRSLLKMHCDTTYLLLRPTSQTIVRDVNAMMGDSSRWTEEDKQELESQLVLAMHPRLCLDPSPDVLLAANEIQFQAKKWNHKGLKRAVRRNSQSYLNRAYLCSNAPSPPCLRLYDFINRHRDRKSLNAFHQKLNRATQHTDMWKQRPSQLTVPPKIEVSNYAKLHEVPKYTTDYTPERIQEIILEGEKANNRSHFCRVTIQRRCATGEYIGEMYLEEDRSAKDEARKEGRACRFSLGNRLNAQRYLQQFQDLYTEEGQTSVRISTTFANQSQQQKPQQQLLQQQPSLTTTQPTIVQQSSVASTISLLPSTVQSFAGSSQKLAVPGSESALTLNLNRTFGTHPSQASLSQHGTYILANTALQPQPLNIVSNVVALASSSQQAFTSTNVTFTASANPYIVNATGALQQAVHSKAYTSPGKLHAGDGSVSNVHLTTAYIQPVTGSALPVSSHGQLTAVPIAVQGNSVSIVSGNMGGQFIAAAGGLKAAQQSIRPASAGQIMLQNAASVQLGLPRLQAQFAVPGNLVPISQMARPGQKGQLHPQGMASVMMHGKQVVVQGSPMLQGQATFIPSQGPLIPGLQGGQTAIIQGGSIFVQGQPGQSIAAGQHQGQTVMIQSQPGQVISQHQAGQGALVQGQTVFIQGQAQAPGQSAVVQGQTIMLQNQSGQQAGQLQIINTSSSPVSQQLQIISQQLPSKSTANSALLQTSQQSTALSALTSQVNLIPIQGAQQTHQYQPIVQFASHAQPARPAARRKSGTQPNAVSGGKRRPNAPSKPSPS